MYLRDYLSIARRFWPLILLLPLLVGGLSLGLALRRPALYEATARMLITVAPLPADAPAPLPTLDDEASWATTEYILDDLSFVLQSAVFAEDLAAAATAEGYAIDAAAARGAVRAEVTHRAVYLSGTAATPEAALALTRGAVSALQAGGLSYWGRATGGGLQIALLDPPTAAAPVGGLRDLLFDVGARTALALAAAVGAAFLLHALDDRLRSRAQAEEWTGARVIGTIPKESARPADRP